MLVKLKKGTKIVILNVERVLPEFHVTEKCFPFLFSMVSIHE